MLLELSAGPPHVQCRTRAKTGETKLAHLVDCKTLDAQQYGNIDFVGDIRDLEKLVPASSCREIYFIHGPEHLPYFEHVPMFQRIWRTLRPGGVFRFCAPNIRAVIERFRWDEYTDAEFLDWRWRVYGQAEAHPVYQVHYSGFWPRYALGVMQAAGFERVRLVDPYEWWTTPNLTNMDVEGYRPV